MQLRAVLLQFLVPFALATAMGLFFRKAEDCKLPFWSSGVALLYLGWTWCLVESWPKALWSSDTGVVVVSAILAGAFSAVPSTFYQPPDPSNFEDA